MKAACYPCTVDRCPPRENAIGRILGLCQSVSLILISRFSLIKSPPCWDLWEGHNSVGLMTTAGRGHEHVSQRMVLSLQVGEEMFLIVLSLHHVHHIPVFVLQLSQFWGLTLLQHAVVNPATQTFPGVPGGQISRPELGVIFFLEIIIWPQYRASHFPIPS